MPAPKRLLSSVLLLTGCGSVLFGLAMAATGGPDGGGFEYVDSDETDGPPHKLLDIDDEGTELSLADEDTAALEIPFDLDWYGETKSTVYVGDNGTAFFSGGQDATSAACPGTGTWTGVAAYWDDLQGGTARFATLGRSPNRILVLDWQGFTPKGASGTGQVQAWFQEGRASEAVIVLGDVSFGSASFDGGVGAMIGTQGATDGLEWACSGGLSDGTSAWFGDPDDRPSSSSVELATESDWEWSGSSDYTYLGEALATGDVNGDGLDELLMAAPEGDTVWLAYGGASPEDGSVSGASASFEGASKDELGTALAIVDLDGDGLPELVMSEPLFDGAGSKQGAVYLFANDSFSGTYTVASDADAQITATLASTKLKLGTGMAAPGDVDGDGYQDLAIGAPGATSGGNVNAGEVHLWSGGSVLGGALSGVSFAGKSAGDKLGGVIAGGDADGDGVADLWLGSPGSDDGGTDAGQAWLVLGSSGLSGGYDVSGASTASFTGDAALDGFGSALLLTDLDGDGVGELIAGAPEESTGGSGAGAAYVFLDGSSWSGTYAAADADLMVTGGSTSMSLGEALAAVDLDADGVQDLAIGAPGANASAGGAYVFMGPITAGTLGSADAEHALSGGAAAGAAGSVVAGMEDHDGDGYGELAIGAWFAGSGSKTLAGVVSIWGWAESFRDQDGDGLVSIQSGGPDCDDGDAGAYPGLDEDTALDSGFADDNDCDGWRDGGYWLRLSADQFDQDTSDLLGISGGESFDFEGASIGDDVSALYSGNGVTLSAATLVAASAPFGAAASGDLAAKISGNLTLTFDSDVDALSFRLLDADSRVAVQAWDGDGVSLLASGGKLGVEHFGDDVPGGRFVGVVFSERVQELRISASSGDGIGIDDIEVFWSEESDRDGDGFTGLTGDCDDSDPLVNPDASEDLGDGIDNDCDGVVDGGVSTEYSDGADWEAASGVTVQTMDFEDLTRGATVSTDYADLGLSVDSSLTVVADIDGAAPNDTQGAQASLVTVTLSFDEVQPSVALELFDGQGSFTLTGYAHGYTLYTDTLVLSEEGSSSLHGFVYDYGVDTLEITGPSGDVWGVDDLSFSELGLDDADGDGFTETEGDCDDGDASVYSGAPDAWYDGVDSDCDGASDYDADADGYDSDAYGGADCDDGDAAVNPAASEIWYDGVDTDCDGLSDFDADGDGYDSDSYGGLDCDDSEPAVSPGASEVFYDSVDDNCDESDDYDADGDGYASADYPSETGSIGGDDCDDTTASVSPGASEIWYDGADTDCDGASDYDADADGHDSDAYGGDDCDDGVSTVYPGATDSWYDGVDSDCQGDSDYDADGDAYDSDSYGGDDCDDTDSGVNPGATESDPDDGVDEDCDGTDEWDDDLDGYRDLARGGTDCDDADASVYPGAAETCYDGVDSDCGGGSDYDCDSDGYDSDSYGGDDCDDTSGSVNPGATEYLYDGVDSDCSGGGDYDGDGDGYDVDFYGGDDCDDTDAAINPGASEIWYDGTDQDCAADSDYDADGDGHESDAYLGDDCDDTDPTICPSCVDIPDDGIDQDCDGADDLDGDGDGYGSDDCDDTDPDVHPGAAELWYDGFDQDCDGLSDYDADQDGQDGDLWGGDDCDDADPTVYFGGLEVWYDGRDGDCLGGDDFDQDGDGFQIDSWGGADCDDTNPDIHPDITEDACFGGDEDCDGLIDEDCLDTGDTADTADTFDTSETDDTGESGDTGETGDSAEAEDSGGPQDSKPGGTDDTSQEPEGGCGGCSGVPGGGGGLAVVLAGVLLWRRRE